MKRISTKVWVLIGLGVAATVVSGVIFWKFIGSAMDEWVSQVAVALDDIPQIQLHIGEIEDISLDFIASGNEPDDDVFVFDVVGSRGSGTVTAKCLTVSYDEEQIVSGHIVMSSGEKYDLFP